MLSPMPSTPDLEPALSDVPCRYVATGCVGRPGGPARARSLLRRAGFRHGVVARCRPGLVTRCRPGCERRRRLPDSHGLPGPPLGVRSGDGRLRAAGGLRRLLPRQHLVLHACLHVQSLQLYGLPGPMRADPRRLRRHALVWNLRPGPDLRRRRLPEVWYRSVHSNELREAGSYVRASGRRLRQPSGLRDVPATGRVRRRRDDEPVRLHAPDVLHARMAVRDGRRRLRRCARLRRLRPRPDLRCELARVRLLAATDVRVCRIRMRRVR
jgi:hypothetical protein